MNLGKGKFLSSIRWLLFMSVYVVDCSHNAGIQGCVCVTWLRVKPGETTINPRRRQQQQLHPIHHIMYHITMEGREGPKFRSQCKIDTKIGTMLLRIVTSLLQPIWSNYWNLICWLKRKGTFCSVVCYLWRHAATRRAYKVVRTTTLSSVQAIYHTHSSGQDKILTPHWQSGRVAVWVVSMLRP